MKPSTAWRSTSPSLYRRKISRECILYCPLPSEMLCTPHVVYVLCAALPLLPSEMLCTACCHACTLTCCAVLYCPPPLPSEMLYCTLTCQLMDKSLEAVKRHMQGKKFVRGKGGAELGRRLGGGTCRSIG